MDSQDTEAKNSIPSRFLTTRWTIVLEARIFDPDRSREALETLCRNYWFPLYSYIRRKGYNAHDAEDLTQGFFARLLSHDFLKNVTPQKGKFRSFLLASLSHHLKDERSRSRRLKRGGGRQVISMDQVTAEKRYQLEAVDELTPEHLFEKQWALTILETVLIRLQTDYRAQGKGPLFDKLKVMLTAAKGAVTYGQLALELDMTETAIRMAVSRLRQRYREYLHQEIAQTVSCVEDVAEELDALFQAMSR